MSDQLDLDQSAYEADARRWLRVYPPRWRRAREDEVLGVLLDTRPPGARRLPVGARADLLRGALAYRWRSHPPLVAWLTWRFNQSRLPVRYAEWVRDDVEGRFFPLRKVWGGGLLVFVAFNLLLTWSGGPDVSWLLLVFVLAVSVVAMLVVRDGMRQRTLDDAIGWQQRIEQVSGADAPRWSGARRWSYGRWLVGPVVAGWLGLLVAGALTVSAAAAAGTSGTAAAFAPGPSPSDVSPMMLTWGVLWAAWAVTVLLVCRDRVRARPPQPWRAELRDPAGWVVAGLTVLAALLPSAALAGRLDSMIGAVADPSLMLAAVAPVASALAPLSFAVGFLGTPLLAAVLVMPGVHLRVRAELANRPGPVPALVDALGLHGGREVLTDPPRVPAEPIPWV